MTGDPSHGRLREVRSIVLALVTVALTTGAHAVGGGGVPTGSGLAALALVACAGSLLLTGRRVGWLRALCWLGAVQGAGHVVLGGLVAAAPGPVHGPVHALVHAPAGGPPDASPGTGLLLAHGLATVLTAVAVGLGDRCWYAVCGLLRPRPVNGPVAVAPVRHRIAVVPAGAAPGRAAYRVPWRRGPPRRG